MSVRFAAQERSESGGGPALARTTVSGNSGSKDSFRVTRSGKKFDLMIKPGHPDEIDGDAIANLDAVAENIKSNDEDALVVALFETGQALQDCREYAIQVLVPLICDYAPEWSYQLKISAGETLNAVVNSGIIPEDLARKISRAATVIIGTPCVHEMFETWSDLLVAVLKYVNWSAEQLDSFLDFVDSVYTSSSGLLSRQLTARVLGSLAASKKSDEDLINRILRRALTLSSDKNVSVRGMVAESFSHIGASVSLSVVESQIWPRLVKLLRDKDARIRAASLQSLSFISAAHRGKGMESKYFAKLLVPIFREECKSIRRDAAEDQRDVDEDKCLLLEVNAEIFGELLFTCSDCLPDDNARKEVYKAFLAMCTSNSPNIRRYCAFNMPAVALCLGHNYRIEIASLVRFLSQDKDNETRWVLAAGLHESLKILASRETVGDLLKAVHVLIEDEIGLVRKNVHDHLEGVITDLSKHLGHSAAQKLGPIFQNLDLVIGENWTFQVALTKQLQLSASIIPTSCLRMDVIPFLSQLADSTGYIGRKSAMVALAICMRYLSDIRARQEVMGRFIVEWARGHVFWMRISFLDAAEAACSVYSRCLFRDTFAPEVLRLALDQVPNIRLRIALLLPKIAPACNLMYEFHNAIETLKKDEDMDVVDAVKDIEKKISNALEEGHERFDEDLQRETEEQELYTRHLVSNREQLRKNGRKRRLLRSARGSAASTRMLSIGSIMAHSDAGESLDAQSGKRGHGTGGKTSNSTANGGKAGTLESGRSFRVKSDRKMSKLGSRVEKLSLSTDDANGGGGTSGSPSSVLNSRSSTLKGLLNLVTSPRTTTAHSRKTGKTSKKHLS